MECLNLILSDYYRLWPDMEEKSVLYKVFHMFGALFTSASFMTTFWFRILTILPPIRKILYLNYKWVNFITGIQLPIGTKIGRGLKFPHYSCIVISKRAIIGNNCTIYQGVTLGKTASGCPVLGNNVIVCANATIVGKVNIGDNAFIGAGAVVVHDVPANSVVVGNPGRVISCKGIEIGKTYL